MASTRITGYLAFWLLVVSLGIGLIQPAPHSPVQTSGDLASAPASPSPYVTTFHISQNSSDFTPFLISPSSPTSAWAVMIQTRNGKPPLAQILNFTIRPNGANWTYALPQPLINIPSDIVYNKTGSTARVWILENDSLAYYQPSTHNVTVAETFLNDSPQYMALDRNGDVWLTLLSSNRIAEFFPDNSTTRFYKGPSPNSSLQGITVAPDGSIWFAETTARKLGHLIPCGSPPCTITDYRPPPSTRISFPIQVAVDHNGTVWFTDHGSNQFGSFSPSTNQWNTFPIGYCSEPYNPDCAIGLPNAISVDSLGMVWFSEHFAGRIAKYNQRTGVLTEYIVPASETQYTWWMSPGPGDLVWFTAFGIGDIGYVNATLPVPFGLSAINKFQIARGTSQNIQATVETANSTALISSSSSSYDAPLGGPSFLSGSLEKTQTIPTSDLSVATLTISAAWDVPLGERNMALTLYNGVVTVNVYVRVNVIENSAPYVTPGAAAAIGVGSIVLYWQNSGKRRKLVIAIENDPGSTRAQSR